MAGRGLRSGGFEIVHAHSGRAQNFAALATAGLSLKRVVTRHVAFAPRHPGVHRLKYTLTCDGIIAVSEAVRRTLLDAGLAAEKIEVIHTGIEFPEKLPERVSHADFVVGHLGAFTQEKGQDVAIAAVRLLAARLPRLQMILAGWGGPLACAEPPAPQILVPGPIENRAAFFASLDLFIMPSLSEAWGLAALEAMANGVPVIASDTGGLPEILGETGWLVPPGDAAALADAIERAAADPEGLRAAGLRARERARCFSIEETAARTEAFYLRLLA